MGAELKQWYLVLGQYDAVVVAEAPDDETIAKKCWRASLNCIALCYD